MDKGRGEMEVKLYYQRKSLGREDRQRLPSAFQGDRVVSARELIKLITDYPKELRKAEVGMMRIRKVYTLKEYTGDSLQ
ncbi:MAG: hypothetical protein ACM3SR_06965 [Ignavibacteriales bacterium]